MHFEMHFDKFDVISIGSFNDAGPCFTKRRALLHKEENKEKKKKACFVQVDQANWQGL